MVDEHRPENPKSVTNESHQQEFMVTTDITIKENGPEPNPALLDAATTPSFADELYEKITSVIGGSNPNQFFCMSLPGTHIDKNLYSYDIEKNEQKPAFVEANESKLVNKLFDACTMTASDNGRHLQTQYKSALDMLTPQLNSRLFDAKSKLRKVLMTPYPYNFGEGLTTGFTLQQVFYRLYSEYVDAKQAWAKVQLDKKTELNAKYPGNSREDNRSRQNDYLDWYETTAESQLLKVQEKLGKVLNVFSPGDMEIITGILDSGAGREVAEARQTLANVQKLNPDGGYVYPVTLYPENWFTLLDTSFTALDLLESPTALAQQLSVLIMQRNNLTSTVNSFLAIIPDEEVVKALSDAHTTANDALTKAEGQLLQKQIKVTSDAIKCFMTIASKSNGKLPDATAAKVLGIDLGKVTDAVNVLTTCATECTQALDAVITAAQNVTSSAMAYFSKHNLEQYKGMLEPLQNQLKQVNTEITELQNKIALSSVMQQAKPAESDASELNDSDVAPNAIPDRFTQIIIHSKMSSVNQSSSSATSASTSSSRVSFFFGGYSSSQSHMSAVNESLAKESDMDIQIGMSVAKVAIGREWFNPGVFLLTKDMYNTSSKKIAPKYSGIPLSKEHFDAMNKCTFPCFPVSFVIARDITIKFSSRSSVSSSFAQSVEDHSARGGGFFIFGGSSSSSSSSSRSNSSTNSTANSVTIRFTSPQIIGYYLEATPADESASLSEERNSTGEFISILDFIKNFQSMLDDYNSTYNRDALQMSPRSNRATD
ncbi:hypothetical protein [Kluyvera genomosp. 1]|uniref:hypothetical protein n=1 Tax=Kluyvera genomosp. 1 TaxID=2774053 RepID=UPI00068CBF07|nr:hypothetical protein [Kluyvera genomosp. 1]